MPRGPLCLLAASRGRLSGTRVRLPRPAVNGLAEDLFGVADVWPDCLGPAVSACASMERCMPLTCTYRHSVTVTEPPCQDCSRSCNA